MDSKELDIAYKYPFSLEAKRIVSEMDMKALDNELLRFGKLRVEEALNNGRIEYVASPFLELKKKYLVSYVYARMLVSSLGNKSYVARYAIAEARRSTSALESESPETIIKICKSLGMDVSEKDGYFEMGFVNFIRNISKNSGISMVNKMLDNGVVIVGRKELSKIVEEAIFREIKKGLPIDTKSIPKEVVAYSKTLKINIPEIEVKVGKDAASDLKRYQWIEKLLSMPIGDVRHRTVNLILAPYLTNVRGLEPEKAAEVIVKYIDRCKEINPDTNVNESYISYQCKYSKARGLRPMTYDRAADMLKGTVTLE